MSHNHHQHKDAALKNIGFAFILNLFFAVVELIGGFYTNSVAIVSNSVHDFGDSVSLGFSWFLQKKSQKQSDKLYTYGYKRYSLLGAIAISLILIISSVFIIKECIERILVPQVANAQGMMLFAFLGIIINGWAAYKLSKGHTLNEKAVWLHFIEDILGWIALLVAGIVMLFANIPLLDPVLSIIITIWVLHNVYKNLKSTFEIMLQQAPAHINTDELRNNILELEHVIDVHDFHLWTLDGENNILSLHVTLEEDTHRTEIQHIKNAIKIIAERFHIHHATIEIEYESEMEHCKLKKCCNS